MNIDILHLLVNRIHTMSQRGHARNVETEEGGFFEGDDLTLSLVDDQFQFVFDKLLHAFHIVIGDILGDQSEIGATSR
ncbi:MAG: hypothetical protein ACI8T1_002403 [Verrucomicrobiales bacterium]|jgi:hypothetical protein